MDVQIRCICPPKDGEQRHETDTVTLRDRLDFRTVTMMRKSIATIETEDQTVLMAERLAALTEMYMLLGIESWSLVDEKGKPLPVTHQAIRDRLFNDSDGSLAVSDAAENLYNPVVLLPLVIRASASSPPTPTPESTSQTTDSNLRPLRPSKRSSTSTSRTVGTETTSQSLGGVSNSSQSSVTAA